MDKNEIITLASGNPGALMFLMELSQTHGAAVTLNKIRSMGIKGTNIYVLWSDLCNKDLDKVEQICINCPEDVLIDACSRDDYSGRELIKEYI